MSNPMRILSQSATALLLVTAACSKQPPPPVDPMAAAYVEVQNQAFLDMTVYVIRSGQRIRLGQVSGN
jgi:NaMN:DMB phosphoribosyltransferase